ncbi:hypothetical protein C0991_003499 [Blastosporella zonata]|nr:hypothetical protein C0991_003499 [Blastosporella zonata]
MDFTDELASLIQQDRAPQHHDDRYHRPTHNIFDISAPPPPSAPPPSDSPSSYPTHFSQTLPALNSSLRYENTPDTNPPPSSFHPHFTRHTPSPLHPTSRSRSRSRPPSSGGGPNPSSGGIGPARTTRARRNNSVSGTSPPPGRPHAIVIPRSRAATVSGNANGNNSGWYMPSHSASEFSLPTPESLSSHHSLSHSLSHHSPQTNPYSPFSLSPPPDSSALHLPPVSALHSLHQQQSYLHHGSPNPHSLPNIHTNLNVPSVPSVGIDSPKSPPDVIPTAPKGTDKQAALANEKRRRRRESHNAVERRRRDNINEKISELATLIPECLLDVGTPPNPLPTSPKDDPSSPLEWKKDPSDESSLPTPGPTSTPSTNNNSTANAGNNAEGLGIVKANKGMILRKSVEYIRYLQQLVEAQGARNRELECELKRWRGRSPSEGSDGSLNGHVHGMNTMDLGMLYSNGNPTSINGNSNGGSFFGLPTMPEGEAEGEEESASGSGGSGDDGMDIETESAVGRGRTRGVKPQSVKGPVNGAGAAGARGKKGMVKEEVPHVEEMMVL